VRFEPRVLVIEDDAHVGTLFGVLLKSQNIAFDLAETAEQGIQAMAKRPYDLFIVDKNLPGQSGLDFLRHVKERLTDVDVILMTAYADMQSVLAALDAGVYDYLVKPFPSIDDVIKKVQRALEKRRILLENSHLVKYLTQANSQIEDMNRHLEAQVQERTRQLQEANARLEQLTLTDDVTGLYNQRFLHARLEEEFQRARRYNASLAVMMLDLDKFKHVNDSHDHLFGSRVLRRVGELLRHAVRDTDLVIRYGGDEFAVILPHTSLSEAAVVGERVRALVEGNDVGDESTSWRATVSVGVASLLECDAQTPKDLLRAADQALYRAKADGRNRIAAMNGKLVVAVVA
jgi:diguanylate cyclase (GGDEF)-like protein